MPAALAPVPGTGAIRTVRSERQHPLQISKTLWRAGIGRPTRPEKFLRTLAVLRRWGLTPAVARGVAAIRYPERAAIVDERGMLTFAEVHRRTNALANALRAAAMANGTRWRSRLAIPAEPRGGALEKNEGQLFTYRHVDLLACQSSFSS